MAMFIPFRWSKTAGTKGQTLEFYTCAAMKKIQGEIQILATVIVATALLCGCSSIKFTEYHRGKVVQGVGGTVYDVDGIEFWESGNPARKYKILGVINQSRKPRLPLGRLTRIFSDNGNSDHRDSAIAKVAREHGGDAVIFVSKDQEQSDEDQFGHGKHRRLKLVVVKYLE
jgi:hypothetical protein